MLIRWLFENVLTWDSFTDLRFFSFSTIEKILGVILVIVVLFFFIDGVSTITHHTHAVTQTLARPQQIAPGAH